MLLAVLQAAAGLWGLLLPRSFFEDAPWVAMLPPYNEHFVRDVGAYNLALAVAIGAAAIILERRLAIVVLSAYAIFTLAHFVFHAGHLDNYSQAAAVAQTATLAVAVSIPIALLVLARRVDQPAPTEYRSGRGRPDAAAADRSR